jgi:hypothetical protein
MLNRGPLTHVFAAFAHELQDGVGTKPVDLAQIDPQHPKSGFSHCELRFIRFAGLLVPRSG